MKELKNTGVLQLVHVQPKFKKHILQTALISNSVGILHVIVETKKK